MPNRAAKNEEVRPYIDFRLRVAGYSGRDLFDSDALSLLTLYSRGIPRLVNIVCDNALLSAFARNEKTISGDMVEEVARDLRLGCEAQQSHAEPTPDLVVPVGQSEPMISDSQPEKVIRAGESQDVLHDGGAEEMVADVFQQVKKFDSKSEAEPMITHAFQRPARRALKFTFATFLMFFGVIVVASFVEPKDFLGTTGKTLEFAKHNLHQWLVFLTNREPLPSEATAEEVTFEPKEQRITIPRGSSVYKLAGNAYGPNSNLGIDLIKEFNPDIKNLSRVSAGQSLVLPSLTPETLLRKQLDGSYHLIVASFRRQITAEEYATRLRTKGYTVTITPKRIGDDLLLHRVEINGLKTFDDANHTWLTALRNEWLLLADNKNRAQ